MILALKIIGWVLLGILALLLLLLIVPVRLRVKYGEELMARLWVLCIPIKLAPKKEKPEKESKEEQADKPAKDEKVKKDKKKKAKKSSKNEADKKNKKKKREKDNESEGKTKKKKDFLSLKKRTKELKENGIMAAAAWLKEIAGMVTTALSQIVDAITVRKFYADGEIAGEDAAQTALTFGKLCATVYPALGIIESKLKVKKQQVRLVPAFCSEETKFSFDVLINVSVWRIVVAAVRFGIEYYKMPSVRELKEQQS